MMHYKMFQQLRQIMQVTISASDKSEFEIYINRINIQRGKTTAMTFIVLEVILIIASFSIEKEAFLEKPEVYYLDMYLIMIMVMAAHLLAFVKLEKNITGNRSAIRIAGITFAGFILFWCAGISLLDQLSTSQILVYTVAVICVAVVPLYPSKTLFLIYFVVEVIFIALMPYFQRSGEISFVNYLNSASFVILSWVISNVMYRSRICDFNNSKIIQEKSDELIRINKKLEEANQALEKLSVTDGLTNIYNRSYFDLAIETEWDQCKRYGTPLSLIMIDIDYFKEFNDHYGHQAGDDCIRQVARVLSDCVKRSSDVAARYGGDEFAIILPYNEKGNALKFAEQIRKKVEDLTIPHANSLSSYNVTLSFGVHTFIPSEESSVREFINHADKALYEAKKDRNKIVAT